jgi:RNA-binding protein Musashi
MAPTLQQAAAVSQLTAAQGNAQQQPQNPQLSAAHAAHAAAAAAANSNPYPGYNLTSVDMSSFNGIDWSSMYGMYV